jgi:hypothetical protein
MTISLQEPADAFKAHLVALFIIVLKKTSGAAREVQYGAKLFLNKFDAAGSKLGRNPPT